jgi:ribosome-associated toxin RatA of RatAB toxin-antitoxin module
VAWPLLFVFRSHENNPQNKYRLETRPAIEPRAPPAFPHAFRRARRRGEQSSSPLVGSHFPPVHGTGSLHGGGSHTRLPAQMHKANSTMIRAPRERIFDAAADLSRWPRILPHYRYIRYLEKSPGRNVVKMAAVRSGIPISWTSEQIIDPDAFEVRFHHLRAFTKGMNVTWTFTETQEGVRVEIVHDLRFRVRSLQPIADAVVGGFFIENIATKTLRCMKAHLEANERAEMEQPS